MNIREYLQENILLFDGAMGTYFARRAADPSRPCEYANLEAPEQVESIHREYIGAGARAIKTNTFAANRPAMGERCTDEIIRAGWEIACRAAGESASVFADIGPIDAGEDDPAGEYTFVASVFLDCGARHFLFETNGSLRGLHEAAASIKSQAPDAFILVSFAVQPDGYTREGELYTDLLRAAQADGNIDAAGLNCVSGARHMAALLERPGVPDGSILSAMPNAGYPTVRGQRTYYHGDPQYFAEQLRAMRDRGVRILGGCCGTTPEYIAAAAEALRGTDSAVPEAPRPIPEKKRPSAPAESPFWTKLCDPLQKPFAVELDSPADADPTRFLAGAEELRDAGADIITIADCPIARARMDSSIMACKLRRELGMDAMPHMTCRDRNRNATQALLLGLHAEGVRSVLLVTGDPVPTASRDEVKSVYNFNSRKLIKYVESLNASVLPEPFHIFAALNVNVRNFHIQLELAREKEENGAVGFLSQPVLTQRGLDNLMLARETLRGKILGGIIPIVSQRNALFMNSEISGIEVDEKIIAAYDGADRARGEELAVDISAAVAAAIAPYVDGYYLMTPFGRTGLMARIIARIHADGNA